MGGRSLLTKRMPNTTPAGAVSSFLSNAMFSAVSSRIVAPGGSVGCGAGVAFGIRFINNDPPPVDHDVDIRTTDSTTVLANNATILQGEITYTIGPLEAGTYTFICSVHPIPSMTGTLTVE